MSRDNDSANEMERIQRGLEAFLDQEMGLKQDTEKIETERKIEAEEIETGRVKAAGVDAGNTEGPEAGWDGTDWDETEEEGEEQTGEMRDSRTKRSGGQKHAREPQLFTLEDWDSPEQAQPRRRSGTQGQPGRRSGTQGQPGRRSTPQEPDKRSKRRSQRKMRRRSGFRRFCMAVVLIIALLGAGLYSLVGVVYNKLNYEEVASVSDLPMQEDGVVNVLLIGNDSRQNGEDGRSDAMILLSVSSRTKTIYMTSLLRDMYVEIPGHDGNRLNAAYSFGGAELLMETVETNFDIPVNRYVQVNFEAFASLVDAVGGVELELTSDEVEYVNGYLVEYNMLLDRPQGTDNLDTSVSGLIHLNGAQALAYCRNRYLGTDFGRTERQRKVLEAVIKKLPAALVTNGSELFNSLMPNLTTNLTKNECFRLSLMAGKLLTYDILSDSIPQPGTYQDVTIRKMAVLQVDFETNKKYLKEKLYGE